MASVQILEPRADSRAQHHRELSPVGTEVKRDAPKIIHDALVHHVKGIDPEACGAGEENSFFVADLGEVMRSYRMWKSRLPLVQAYYAVKCNNDPMVLRTLGMMGCNFDCALKNEIDLVLGLGFDAARIVYANPCKTASFLRHSRAAKVNLTTVDNVHELRKVHAHHPQCRVLVRIATDDESAQCRLSTKFGCTMEHGLHELLPECKRLGLDVAGVAFHVGSGARDFESIAKAIGESRVLFDKARDLGMHMKILDIGGGFEHDTFEQSSCAVQKALEKHFPVEFLEKNGIGVMAEPGRLMVSRAFTLAAHVIARRDLGAGAASGAQSGVRSGGPKAMLYLNDGVYGNLNCILFDHQRPQARVLRHAHDKAPAEEGVHAFSVWGPTCDGLDCISLEMALERDVQVGDWLYFSAVGAYTLVASTSFNGFSGAARVIYVNSEDSC